MSKLIIDFPDQMVLPGGKYRDDALDFGIFQMATDYFVGRSKDLQIPQGIYESYISRRGLDFISRIKEGF